VSSSSSRESKEFGILIGPSEMKAELLAPVTVLSLLTSSLLKVVEELLVGTMTLAAATLVVDRTAP
jgi:hypothetical protein